MKEINNTLDQTLFDNKLNEARLYYDQGLFEEAEEIYGRLLKELKQFPDNKNIKEQIKQLENMRKQCETKLDPGVHETDQEPDKKERSNEDLYVEAIAFHDLEAYGDAISNYKTLIENNYKLNEVIYSLVLCYKERDDRKSAIKCLESITKQKNVDQNKADICFYQLSLLYEELGDYNKSLQLLNSIKNKAAFLDFQNRQTSLKSRIQGRTKFDWLLNQKIISSTDLKNAQKQAQKENKTEEYVLLTSYAIDIEQLGKSLSMFYGYSFVDLTKKKDVEADVIGNLTYQYLKNNHWVPLDISSADAKVQVVVDTLDMQNQDDIRKIYIGYTIQFFIGIREHIDAYIDRQFNQGSEESQDNALTENIADLIEEDRSKEVEEDDDVAEEGATAAEDSKTISFVNKMIMDAYRTNASDIHIEPSTHSKETDIRYRIDGVCHPYVKIPNSFCQSVISRIKIMAKMDIAEKRKPQDGKIKLKSKQKQTIELRVATIPTAGGREDVVLRLLQSGKPGKLSDLGVLDYNLEPFNEAISKPYGMILVVGPTGSGKTSTLHSALHTMNTPDKKIWTAEDPVEIDQPGVRQAEVNPAIGLNFADLLRSFLRADPDIIMVGEMRDNETAQTTIQASLTGHLTLSTLHTNSAPETITRLLEMDIDPVNFGDSLLAVLAQRLGRRLCNKCKQEPENAEQEIDEIIENFGPDPKGLLQEMGKDQMKLYTTRGCEACNNTGYKGRIGFHELLINNSELNPLIKDRAPLDKIKEAAVRNHMYTLKQDGMLKVLMGITTMEEVRRNCI